MDVEIALKFMGWKITHNGTRVRTGDGRLASGLKGVKDCLRYIREVCPDYSTSIAEAWKVVERQVSKGACPALVNDDNGHWALAGEGFQNVPANGDVGDIVTTFFVPKEYWVDEAPHAICLALLLES